MAMERALSGIAPGTVLGGDFRIVRALGAGGMGAVYVAEQLSTGRNRAFKVMQPQLAADPIFRRRFEQEARIGGLIRSDHIVEVIAAGVDAQAGVPWLAMELLSGEGLADRAERGPCPSHEAGEILGQLCHGLAAAHDVPVVHRDLKPENIFLAESRVRGMPYLVKILDLGIARLLVEARTTATAAIGTPLWMAPEQADASNLIGPHTDVWSLGLIAFFLLTGKNYWLGANCEEASIATLLKEVYVDPLALASDRARALGAPVALPRAFDAWFETCVVRAPLARFAHARQAWDALQPILSGTEAAMGLPPRSATAPLSAGGTVMAAPTPAVWVARGAASSTGTMPDVPPLVQKSASIGFVIAACAVLLAAVSGAAFALRAVVRGPEDGREPLPTAASNIEPVAAPLQPAIQVAPVALNPAEKARRDSLSGAMAALTGGTFTMGAMDGDAAEQPEVQVQVGALQLDRYEVTVAAYGACVRDGACGTPGVGGDCNWQRSARQWHPINCVDYAQAEAFCRWAGKRLPTESEWEYGARGTQRRRLPWGDAEPDGRLCWRGAEGTCAVGQFPQGDTPKTAIADLAGNVAEWTSSRFCTHGTQPCNASLMVTRGGDWSARAPSAVRASAREGTAPVNSSARVGFRCAADRR
jgi:formylglycine-generating enzyme required for sulfatase activity/tRNA A-37 threonylcarbamoyl transferase component Bud32